MVWLLRRIRSWSKVVNRGTAGTRAETEAETEAEAEAVTDAEIEAETEAKVGAETETEAGQIETERRRMKRNGNGRKRAGTVGNEKMKHYESDYFAQSGSFQEISNSPIQISAVACSSKTMTPSMGWDRDRAAVEGTEVERQGPVRERDYTCSSR